MSELRSRPNSVQKRTKAKESGHKVHKITFFGEYDASKRMVGQKFN